MKEMTWHLTFLKYELTHITHLASFSGKIGHFQLFIRKLVICSCFNLYKLLCQCWPTVTKVTDVTEKLMCSNYEIHLDTTISIRDKSCISCDGCQYNKVTKVQYIVIFSQFTLFSRTLYKYNDSCGAKLVSHNSRRRRTQWP